MPDNLEYLKVAQETDPGPRALTREAWLLLLVDRLLPLLDEFHKPIPEILVSVGWPSSGGTKKTEYVAGQCFIAKASEGRAHIFISPRLNNVYDIAATLLHELIHAILPDEEGHKGAFKKLHREVGFIDKATLSLAGEELTAKLKAIVDELPPFPHIALELEAKEKKQKNRQLKLTCPLHPDYIVRASRKTIGEAPPLCGKCATNATPAFTKMEEPPALNIDEAADPVDPPAATRPEAA